MFAKGGGMATYFEGFGGDFGTAVIAAEDDDVVCRRHYLFFGERLKGGS